MLLYRITKERYLENFTGRGSSFLNGARWNKKGNPVLYFAPSPSVALLEMANYIPNPRMIPKSTVMGIYELPSSVSCKTIKFEELPEDWNIYPYPLSTQIIGSSWLDSLAELCLYVPSVAVPSGLENIVVINPLHPDIEKLKLTKVTANLYNKRAFHKINK